LELENREFQEQVVAQSSSVMVKEPKVTFPSKFNGDRSQFRGFINQLELIFSLHHERYARDSIKVSTVGTLLCDKALSWFNSFIEHPARYHSILNSWTLFKENFTATFADVDKSLFLPVISENWFKVANLFLLMLLNSECFLPI